MPQLRSLIAVSCLICCLTGCRREHHTDLTEVVTAQPQFETLCGRLILRNDDMVIHGWWLRADLTSERFQVKFEHLRFVEPWLSGLSPTDACLIYMTQQIQRDFVAETLRPHGVYIKPSENEVKSKVCGEIVNGATTATDPLQQSQDTQGLQLAITDESPEKKLFLRSEDTTFEISLPATLSMPDITPANLETGACVYLTVRPDAQGREVKTFSGITPLLGDNIAQPGDGDQSLSVCGTMIYREFPETMKGFWLRESQTLRPIRLLLSETYNEDELRETLPSPVCLSYQPHDHTGWEETISVQDISFNPER